jgi:hypothetical protein
MERQSKGKPRGEDEEEGAQDLELPQKTSKRKPSANCKAIVHIATRQQLATWPAASSAVTITSDQDVDGISIFQYVAERCDSTTSIDVSAIYPSWPPSGPVSSCYNIPFCAA